ncbi:50S ribosomal protein L32e [Candidatus Pacearchaeota archaeon]|nr:50S ribosomal protein L32e [Candidatus Pacearchaeota archaeon]
MVLRKDWHKFHKLGKKVKAKRKWRRARGRHNKIRESKRGHPLKPKIGYKVSEYSRPVTIENIRQLLMLRKEEHAVIAGNVGERKRKEIMERAKSMQLNISNPRKSGIGEKNESA